MTLTDGDAEASITRSSGTSTRTRRMLPFAPALVASIMIAVAYVTATGYDACAQWPGAVC